MMSQQRQEHIRVVWIERWRRVAAAVFVGALLMSWLVAPDFTSAVKASLPLLVGLILYAILIFGTWNLRACHWILRGLCLLSVAILLAALVVMPLPPGGWWPYRTVVPLWPADRLPDTLNGNVVAGALVLLWPFVLSLGLWGRGYGRKTWADRIIALVVGLLLQGVLLLTLSRAAQWAMIISTLLWLLLWRPRLWRWLVLPVLAGIGIALGRLYSHDLMQAVPESEAYGWLAVRVEIWSRAWRIIREFPYTGIGFGNFEQVLLHTAPLTLAGIPAVRHAHNLALQVAVDLGLPGLAAAGVLLLCAYRDACCALRRLGHKGGVDLRLVAISCFAALVGMAIHGLVDSAVWGNKGAFIPWIVMGLATALARRADCSNESENWG